MGHLMERTMKLAAQFEAKRKGAIMDRYVFTPLWPHSETYTPSTVNEAYIDRLYALTLDKPSQAHVLCQVHVK